MGTVRCCLWAEDPPYRSTRTPGPVGVAGTLAGGASRGPVHRAGAHGLGGAESILAHRVPDRPGQATPVLYQGSGRAKASPRMIPSRIP
jgi:hypothetical protein